MGYILGELPCRGVRLGVHHLYNLGRSAFLRQVMEGGEGTGIPSEARSGRGCRVVGRGWEVNSCYTRKAEEARVDAQARPSG